MEEQKPFSSTGDWCFYNVDHSLPLTTSPLSCHCDFCCSLVFLVSSPKLSLGLLREVSWHKKDEMWEEDWGGRNCPGLSTLGGAPSKEDTILMVAAWRSCLPPSAGPQLPASMLSTTMVGALVRGWRNRSSPRRAEPKLPFPQRQGGILIQGMFPTLWYDWMTSFFFLRIQEGDHELTSPPLQIELMNLESVFLLSFYKLWQTHCGWFIFFSSSKTEVPLVTANYS
jgi:hypothetical protein